MQIPQPNWEFYFAAQDDQLIIAFKGEEVAKKIDEFKFTNAIGGKVGTLINHYQVYELVPTSLQPDAIEHALGLIGKRTGAFQALDWKEIAAKGASHPIFLPAHGCFGYINGHLILANRHHMEIMYHLMTDKGWTWDELVEAKQVWGWYTRHPQGASATFSSDAGIMTSPEVKKECIAAFEEYFSQPFQMGNGYGGKDKKTYGGNMEAKYGKPGEWGGYKAELDNTIISELPDPPSASVPTS